jgi:hypothetical protein
LKVARKKRNGFGVDELQDNSELNGKHQIAAFEISNRFRIRIRILRLRQMGLNRRGDHILAFHSFEPFRYSPQQ